MHEILQQYTAGLSYASTISWQYPVAVFLTDKTPQGVKTPTLTYVEKLIYNMIETVGCNILEPKPVRNLS